MRRIVPLRGCGAGPWLPRAWLFRRVYLSGQLSLTPACVPISILRLWVRADRHDPEGATVFAPELMNRFEFVRLSSLRAAQLMRGCTPRVPEGHKRTTTAQHEIAGGKVCRLGLPGPRNPASTS